MKKTKQSPEEYLKEHKEWCAKMDAISEKNRKLIAYWHSIPWWKFWAKPSFETRRNIIMDNWESLAPKEE